MEPTRRGLAAAGCALGLATGAVVLASPALLLAAAGVLAWLLGAQLVFARALGRERDELSVTLTATTAGPIVGQTTAIELSAQGSGRLALRLRVATPAVAGADGDLGVALGHGEGSDADSRQSRAGTEHFQPSSGHSSPTATGRDATGLEWTVAGTFRVGPARVEAIDRLGLFTATFDAGESLAVEVRPRTPDTGHLGRGTDVVAAYGEHSTGRRGPGIEPAELRPYHPGDDVARIDWNATARLREAYVADSEAETDRRTVLLVDHRATSGVGPDGATPWTYLRHAALAIVESARDVGDPIGLYAVGDGGVTAARSPQASPTAYDAVSAELRTLSPTAALDATAASEADVATATPSGDANIVASSGDASTGGTNPAVGTPTVTTSGPTRDDSDPAVGHTGAVAATSTCGPVGTVSSTGASDPAAATRAAGRLAGDDIPFARTLRPLLADAEPYLHRVADEPLFAAARTYLGRLQGTLWTVVCADDARPGELRETVKLARRGHDRVLVLLAPRSLYGIDGTADLAERYRAYATSADFRRSLAAMERVEVREVAPGDAVEAVLSAGGDRA